MLSTLSSGILILQHSVDQVSDSDQGKRTSFCTLNALPSLEEEHMARKTQVTLIDDVDGSAATTTIGFGLDGVSYEIDLGDENATKLREGFAQWIEHGRRTGGRARRGAGAVRSSEAKRIREWARDNGLEVSDRGRVSSEVQEAYAAANAKN